jgi:hypothetical protein
MGWSEVVKNKVNVPHIATLLDLESPKVANPSKRRKLKLSLKTDIMKAVSSIFSNYNVWIKAHI